MSQIVADVFGVKLNEIFVNSTHDTHKDSWSIAAGNYSSRFAGAVAGSAYNAAINLKKKLQKIAASVNLIVKVKMFYSIKEKFLTKKILTTI